MILAINKKAKLEFDLDKKYRAGIVLTGAEVKSLRLKYASLTGSYVKIVGNEAFLINAQINPYKFAVNEDYDPKRTRKLLLKKKEIGQLVSVSDQKGWGIVAISIELVGNLIKLNFGVGKGRKLFEKREQLKKKDLKRSLDREMKKTRLKI